MVEDGALLGEFVETVLAAGFPHPRFPDAAERKRRVGEVEEGAVDDAAWGKGVGECVLLQNHNYLETMCR